MINKILLALWLAVLGAGAMAAGTDVTAMAFFYGAKPPWSELQAFDLVVVDPDHVPDPKAPALSRTRLAAYVALGEVQPSRAYAPAIPKAWLMGDNKDWGSRLIDQSRPEWPRFFTDQVVAPLWGKGYRTFFLDTLDSYHLFAKTPEQKAVQEAGMVSVVETLKRRYPEIKLIFNRGFEILPRVHPHVEMVVAESLFRGYDAGKKKYREVPEADREWLLGQLRHARDEYKLAVTVIDYVPVSQRELARSTAQRILNLGFTPWVATPDLGTLGVGTLEVMPRKVLVVHSVLPDEYALRGTEAARLGALPLNYLGYVPEYVDVAHLPESVLLGRYAGILVWLSDEPAMAERQRLMDWLTAQIQATVPVALVSPPDFLWHGPMARTLGLKLGPSRVSKAPLEISQQSPLMGFEVKPQPEPGDLTPLALLQGEPLLTIRQGQQEQVAAALTPWGGYVLGDFSVLTLPGDTGDRWVINPFAFFQKALRLPAMPVPDVTTESGRRMLMVHMDGDGFVSHSELPGNPMAGELVLERVVKKYPIPMTMSIIEAEISAQGLYADMSRAAEKIARNIFSQTHVAMASHSYSHPFVWSAVAQSDGNEGYNLRLPGYRFDLQREIEGSIRYMERQLAPPGKKVEVFLWTGNCVPGSDALAWTQKLGVFNMNGGDTVATRSQPTVTQVEGLGVPRETGFQVYAPNQNENVYTHEWRGPFYGYERVIETFEFTEKPRRLKPMDIYFHTYITTKAAGMKSLDKVFAYALAQDNTPVHVADYARQVLDFQSLVVARTPGGWRVRGAGHARTLRFPETMGWPDLAASRAVAGYNSLQGERYVHLSGDEAELVLTQIRESSPRLASANARIDHFEPMAGGYRWDLSGYVPLKFTLANSQGCQVRVSGRVVTPVRRHGDVSEFEIKDHVARPLETLCRG
ncbi:bifunctional glycoside hydrolase 114/ polysaccharide deacetylase family protein [Rhodoferax sp.]|uniref:bifunctional glycoside hydrolase 114/ polysaccharide deacetylase family protein n=1 Tax=Rhodoferax sp. TaxID=50421 RepID=UPI00263A385B|nr:bifunctional glycoside hydrolase 114/ polysaccharide deacetylase family protein [Rhodoferax sp.]MDD2923904.1 bifunctional glycoside hydrolase 114/ polysaccharide deacetylase family protein [Rhodoferax sp.]